MQTQTFQAPTHSSRAPPCAAPPWHGSRAPDPPPWHPRQHASAHRCSLTSVLGVSAPRPMLTPQPASATHHNLRRHPNLRSYTLSMSCAAILPAQPPHTTVPGPLLLYRLPSDALAHPPLLLRRTATLSI